MPDVIPDFFSGDMFSSVTLTDMVNTNPPQIPMFLQDLGLAQSAGMLTTDAAFAEEQGSIRMMSSIPRGAPPSQMALPTGRQRKLSALHFAREAEVNAEEVLNVLVRGGGPQTVQNLIRQRVDGPFGLRVQWAYTLEHLLMGLIDGQVYDADNTTELYNFFTFFGVARPAAINIPISTMGADTAVSITAGMALRRGMATALNGMPTGQGRIVALTGDNFFDALVTSKELVAARKNGTMGNQDAALRIAEATPWSAVVWAGVTWINYHGSDDGLVAIPTDEARAFMVGVPGLFQLYYAPADTFETVGQIGLPLYLLNLPERQTSKRAVFELQSNPLPVCTRPLSLRRITKS